jgi:protein-disulfide isomerase
MNRLSLPVTDRDHRKGPESAPILLVEYGDFQCPHCAAAFGTVKTIQTELGDQLCFVYRHFPLIEVHPYAEPAAEAAEAASAQRKFWEMHDEIYKHSPDLDENQLSLYARQLGLESGWFNEQLSSGRHAGRVEEDMRSGLRSGVKGTPTFFINGSRYQGTYDEASLLDALRVAQ